MKMKLFYLAMAILFTLTSCQKEEILTSSVEAVKTTNSSTIGTTDLSSTNDIDTGSKSTDLNLFRLNNPLPPIQPPSCFSSSPFYIVSLSNYEFVAINNSPCYNGPLTNLQHFEWTIGASISGTPIPIEYSYLSSIEIPLLNNSSDHYWIVLKAVYSNGTELKVFCLNNYNGFNECTPNPQFNHVVIGSGGPGIATTSFILP